MTSRCVVLCSTDDDFLVTATRLLSSLAQVVWARSPAEALEKSDSMRPDVVVLDGTAGFDASRDADSLKAAARPPRVVALVTDGVRDAGRADAALPRRQAPTTLGWVIQRLFAESTRDGREPTVDRVDR
jgi:chemotaxis response regulator CheB